MSANPEAAEVLSPQDMDIVQAEETADRSPVTLEFSPESDSRRYCLRDRSGLHAPLDTACEVFFTVFCLVFAHLFLAVVPLFLHVGSIFCCCGQVTLRSPREG